MDTTRLLSLIELGDRFVGLCEALGGFRNEDWMELTYNGGEIEIDSIHWARMALAASTNHKEVMGTVTVIRLVHYDLDYENFVLAQVWDRRDTSDRHWEYLLFHNTGANDWVPEIVWWWGADRPSFAAVGDAIDRWA